MGAGGRDFHAFNTRFKDEPAYEVVAFTATQIPGIDDKIYPASLAGELYPNGIPIYPEEKLIQLIPADNIDAVIFAYSDVSHEYVMHKASSVLAAGADSQLLGTRGSMLKSANKIISVCAIRTGCGKSQTSRKIVRIFKDHGKKAVIAKLSDLRQAIAGKTGTQILAD